MDICDLQLGLITMFVSGQNLDLSSWDSNGLIDGDSFHTMRQAIGISVIYK